MSDLISLEQAKKHLYVISTDEDDLIQLFIDAAIDNVRQWIDRPLDGTDPIPVVLDSAIPPNILGLQPSLKSAALLILGDLFDNREANLTELRFVVNPTLERLMTPYRRMGV